MPDWQTLLSTSPGHSENLELSGIIEPLVSDFFTILPDYEKKNACFLSPKKLSQNNQYFSMLSYLADETFLAIFFVTQLCMSQV